MERKKENSSAASRDMPAICPAAIVHIEREVPGKIAESICTAPIQIAVGQVRFLHLLNCGLTKSASTTHMTMPPMSSASAIT